MDMIIPQVSVDFRIDGKSIYMKPPKFNQAEIEAIKHAGQVYIDTYNKYYSIKNMCFNIRLSNLEIELEEI